MILVAAEDEVCREYGGLFCCRGWQYTTFLRI